MTNQELFDTVCSSLIKQGKPSVSSDGRCLYRSPDGCKCAAGFLIPDDKYDPRMEDCGVETAFDMVDRSLDDADVWDAEVIKRAKVLQPVLAEIITEDQQELLVELQHCHDRAAYTARQLPKEFLPTFIEKARDVAEYFSLNTDVLK